MAISGFNFIGYTRSAGSGKGFYAFEPASGEYLPETFYTATHQEVEQAVVLADHAFPAYSAISPLKRADFLIAITEEILSLGDELLERASRETGLSPDRLSGERTRTINQLTQFADLLREGSWVQAVIDKGDPDRKPLSKPDIRKMLVPIGPVVVFGSSNFPFAYSVAGVDTGPALAAGNPVVVKAHPAHPGVSELTAQAVLTAAQRTGMPEGVFSMIFDDGYKAGEQLVKHPLVKAAGFTGSYRGGMALHRMAQEREEPIPVYAEMGSVNPIVIMQAYLKENTASLAKTLAASVTLGAGQFCTNPGLVFVVSSDPTDAFEKEYAAEVRKVVSTTMLTKGIHEAFFKLRAEELEEAGVQLLAESDRWGEGKTQSQATIAKVSGVDFILNPRLQEEIFGPFSLLVVCTDEGELVRCLRTLKGQLTASLFTANSEFSQFPEIQSQLRRIAGRVILNAVPTGVEVCNAMHHGGPYPATVDSKFTSVGVHSILRFVRPQAFQGWPDELLPEALQEANPSGIWRLVDNHWAK